MKAITIWQPWASAIAHGLKKIETRSWATAYRGPLAIHAGKRPVDRVEAECFDRAVWGPLGYATAADLPLGKVVAVALLADCLPTEHERFDGGRLSDQEWEWGDFSVERFGWLLDSVQRLPAPIPAKGAQGLWEWDAPRGIDCYRPWEQCWDCGCIIDAGTLDRDLHEDVLAVVDGRIYCERCSADHWDEANAEFSVVQPPAHKLYTYGYGGRGRIEDLLGYAEAGCHIVDVRLRPYSRIPGWNRSALQARLLTRYNWFPSLGNTNFRGGPIQLANPALGCGCLCVILASHPVVLLCGCKDAAGCHRSVVAAEAQRRMPGLEVVHLAQGQAIEAGA